VLALDQTLPDDVLQSLTSKDFVRHAHQVEFATTQGGSRV
jgi:hypothetical protein